MPVRRGARRPITRLRARVGLRSRRHLALTEYPDSLLDGTDRRIEADARKHIRRINQARLRARRDSELERESSVRHSGNAAARGRHVEAGPRKTDVDPQLEEVYAQILEGSRRAFNDGNL